MESSVTYGMASNYTLLGRKKLRGNFSSLRLYRVIQREFLTLSSFGAIFFVITGNTDAEQGKGCSNKS
jgi:hypothetical protein